MTCQTCKSSRLLSISAKCSDLFNADTENEEYMGYVPKNLGIGGGDYVRFKYCLECGQIQGAFPIPRSEVEELWESEED